MRHPIILLLGMICLSSCTRESNWEISTIQTGQKEFDSAKISYLSPDSLRGMNLEFVYSNGLISGYLNFFSHHFEKAGENQGLLKYGSESCEIPLMIHEGLMRACLSNKITDQIVHLLLEDHPITIIVDSLEQEFQPEQFNFLFHQMTK